MFFVPMNLFLVACQIQCVSTNTFTSYTFAYFNLNEFFESQIFYFHQKGLLVSSNVNNLWINLAKIFKKNEKKPSFHQIVENVVVPVSGKCVKLF